MPETKMSLFDLVGDLVIFRDLNPLDARLPRFDDAWQDMGLSSPARPRKHEPEYARAVAWLLGRARSLERPDVSLQEIFYIGDTALSDGNAFLNLRAAGNYRGWAFIGAERSDERPAREDDGIYVANHWRDLAEYIARLLGRGAALDACTAAIVDIDKTALGARGRNDRVIDGARIAAMETLMAEVLGSAYSPLAFQAAYAEFNASRYHPFTADNQDYLAYVCLMVTAGLCSVEDLAADIRGGRPATFPDFLALVDARRSELAPALASVHDEVRERVAAQDPTPFKTFRRREYRETADRMGNLPDAAPEAQRLAEEICLTQEVIDLLRWLQARGCLLLALSDKPDEATIPAPDLAALGYRPLHRIPTHVAGPSIAHLLS
jgi:hypothetical protein